MLSYQSRSFFDRRDHPVGRWATRGGRRLGQHDALVALVLLALAAHLRLPVACAELGRRALPPHGGLGLRRGGRRRRWGGRRGGSGRTGHRRCRRTTIALRSHRLGSSYRTRGGSARIGERLRCRRAWRGSPAASLGRPAAQHRSRWGSRRLGGGRGRTIAIQRHRLGTDDARRRVGDDHRRQVLAVLHLDAIHADGQDVGEGPAVDAEAGVVLIGLQHEQRGEVRHHAELGRQVDDLVLQGVAQVGITLGQLVALLEQAVDAGVDPLALEQWPRHLDGDHRPALYPLGLVGELDRERLTIGQVGVDQHFFTRLHAIELHRPHPRASRHGDLNARERRPLQPPRHRLRRRLPIDDHTVAG